MDAKPSIHGAGSKMNSSLRTESPPDTQAGPDWLGLFYALPFLNWCAWDRSVEYLAGNLHFVIPKMDVQLCYKWC